MLSVSQGLLLSVLLVSSASAVPLAEWKAEIKDKVDAIVKGTSAKELEGEQLALSWEAASSPPAEERPRPPALDGAISALRGVSDGFTLESISDTATAAATSANFGARRAKLRAEAAVPEQGIARRAEEIHACERVAVALGELEGTVAAAISHSNGVTAIRERQGSVHLQGTEAAKELTTKNIQTLAKIVQLITEEINAEADDAGASHFDPIALRTRTPTEILSHALALAQQLGEIIEGKLRKQEEALSKIADAFDCTECAEGAKQLMDLSGQLAAQQQQQHRTCSEMKERNRVLDEADRERVLALKKDLEELDLAEKAHQESAAALAEERKIGSHVTDKMIGFFQHVPGTVPV